MTRGEGCLADASKRDARKPRRNVRRGFFFWGVAVTAPKEPPLRFVTAGVRSDSQFDELADWQLDMQRRAVRLGEGESFELSADEAQALQALGYSD